MLRDDLIHGDLPIIDLDRLAQPVAKVKLFGNLHDVRPVDGRAADLLHQVSDARQRAENGDADSRAAGLLFYDVAREIVASVMPSLPAEQRARLTIDQMTSIIGIATKQVKEVEAAMERAEGNGSGPVMTEVTEEAATSVSPVLPSTARSGPSSSGSRAIPAAPSSKSRTTRTH